MLMILIFVPAYPRRLHSKETDGSTAANDLGADSGTYDTGVYTADLVPANLGDASNGGNGGYGV